jgi:hypothetical protein
LYAYDGDGPAPRLTTDPAITKVGHFPIRMPRLEGVKPGDKVSLTIRMYFGLTEIKIECVIQDQTFVFTSAFDASDSHSAATPMHEQQQHSVNNYVSLVPSAQAIPSSYGYTQQSYPANVMPAPPLYDNNSSTNLSYSASISHNNHDYYSQQQPPRQSYTTQQARQSYPPQGYYDHTNGGYPSSYNNTSNTYTR